jgi:hypothetical protein
MKASPTTQCKKQSMTTRMRNVSVWKPTAAATCSVGGVVVGTI